MKIPQIILIANVLLLFGCGAPPKPFEIKDVCAQLAGTNVIAQVYISIPREMEITRYTRGGQGAGITYKLFVMSKADATGDSVAAVFSGTSIPEKNKIKMFPENYTWNDLIAYTDKNEEVRAGKVVKITGETATDAKMGCSIGVSKIELP